MKRLSIGIIVDKNRHYSSWSFQWEDYCKSYNIEYELIYWKKINSIDKMLNHEIILWHYGQYSYTEMTFAENILKILKKNGCLIFPDELETFHFDDKIIQSYLLKSLNINTPKNYIFYDENDIFEWPKYFSKFPIVAKLRVGSGSQNVRLIHNEEQLYKYSKKMFSNGYRNVPSFFYKLYSNVTSLNNFKTFIDRLKKIIFFLQSKKKALKLNREHSYVYLQEYIPNSNFDLKIVVIKDKLSFLCRHTRPNDFRASGSGNIFYDHSLINKQLINYIFEAYDKINCYCLGFDVVVDKRNNSVNIIEISYGFNFQLIMNANGYYDRNYLWHNVPLNAPNEILKILISKYED